MPVTPLKSTTSNGNGSWFKLMNAFLDEGILAFLLGILNSNRLNMLKLTTRRSPHLTRSKVVNKIVKGRCS